MLTALKSRLKQLWLRFLSLLRHPVTISVLSAIVALWSAWEARDQSTQAKRSADAAAVMLKLQAPSLLVSLWFDRKRPVLLVRDDEDHLSYYFELPLEFRLENTSISPVGLSTVSATWSGLDQSFSFRSGINPALDHRVATSLHRPVQRDRRTPLVHPQASVAFEQPSSQAVWTDDPPIVPPTETRSVRAVMKIPLTPGTSATLLCSAFEATQNTKAVTGECASNGPWRFPDMNAFEEAIAQLTGGYNIFGRPAFASEVFLPADEIVALHVTLALSTGGACTVTVYPDVLTAPERVECKQEGKM